MRRHVLLSPEPGRGGTCRVRLADRDARLSGQGTGVSAGGRFASATSAKVCVR